MSTRTRQFSVRIPSPIVAVIEAIAEKETRSKTGQILHYVREGLRRDGLLPRIEPDASANGASK